jgi:plasmid stability protein
VATIQVRDVPDDVAEVLRRRAEAAGRSLQSYMREQIIALAQRRDRAEVLAVIEQVLAEDSGPGLTSDLIHASLGDLRVE